MSCFYPFVPDKSVEILQRWIDELDVTISILDPRKTKLGDFKARRNRLYITINNNLNQYSFLITLTHELSHAFVFKKYKKHVKPHGKIWQSTFKSLMLNFLTPDYFPEDILKVLSLHMISPKASTYTDFALARVLRDYDQVDSVILSDLAVGDFFKITNGRIFQKGEKRRKRYRCVESKTKNVYLLHPFLEVIRQ